MSLDVLRKQVLSNEEEEKVEVNQRHLIDKVLARYSTKFVVFRELMQNADDAKSSKIEIFFETDGSTEADPNIKICTRILFKNNGFIFRPEDWDRLKKIAEGNPDQQKIGAFGVGFYSLFSVCEEPFIFSGDHGMGFYWRNCQLHAKFGPIDNNNNQWTTFLMDLREPFQIPTFDEFGKFLATSMVFTENLREICVHTNNTRNLKLSKKIIDTSVMEVPKHLNTCSPRRIFYLKSINVRRVEVQVERLNITANSNTTFSCQMNNATIHLHVATGNLDVDVTETFSAEMERSIKKKPPTTTVIQLLFPEFEYGLSVIESRATEDVSKTFNNLLPYPEQGRIFIGFPTHQTTGHSSHLAARFIPTVERESIDLVDKTLAIYNEELLSTAGILTRVVYEEQMDQLSHFYTDSVSSRINPDGEEVHTARKLVQKKAARILNHFTFRSSTPNNYVGTIMERMFFSCSNKPLSVISSIGVRPIQSVRLPDAGMEGFIKVIPVIPKNVLNDCRTFFEKAKERRIIKEITLEDVLNLELQERILTETEMTALMQWWIGYCSKSQVSDIEKAQFLLQATTIVNDKVLALASFKHFLNSTLAAIDSDFPINTLPYTITKTLVKKSLENYFGNYRELPLLTWVEFIIKTPKMLQKLESDTAFAENFLGILGQSFKSLSTTDQEALHTLLNRRKIIPTKYGMFIPDQSYLSSVTVLPDLPTIYLKKPRRALEPFLTFLGVRKYVELQLIFDRLIAQGNWDHINLVKYLIPRVDDITPDEKEKLRTTAIWPCEDGRGIKKHLITDLYAPLPELKELDLPIIKWKKGLPDNLAEAKFLTSLGLRIYPPLNHILSLAAPPTETKLRCKALDYFLRHFKDYYATDYTHSVNTAFLPCADPTMYATPSNCFANPACSDMGFNVLRHDLRIYAAMLFVEQDPPKLELTDRLINKPPKNNMEARKTLEYLATQLGVFENADWEELSGANFIPITDDENHVVHTNPNSCLLESHDERYKGFFTYVDFGEKANLFLKSCGVHLSPSAEKLAWRLVHSSIESPSRMDKDGEHYKEFLYSIAIGLNTIRQKPKLISAMKQSPMFLGYKIVSSNGEDKTQSFDITTSQRIFISDSDIIQRMFDVLICPEEEYLERLYEHLGSMRLKQSVAISHESKGQAKISEQSAKLESLIRERIPLYLCTCSSRSSMSHDTSWVQNISVREVQEIRKTYLLIPTGESKTEQTSCYLCNDNDGSERTLLITGGQPEYSEIAANLDDAICIKPSMKHSLALASILTMPLDGLRKLGCPVDRIARKRQRTKTIAVDRGWRTSSIWRRTENRQTGIPIPSTPDDITTIEATIRKALKTFKPYPGTMIKSQTTIHRMDVDSSSYCDITTGHSLEFICRINQIEVYASKPVGYTNCASIRMHPDIKKFAKLLDELCSIFELSMSTVHIFYEIGKTQAFNRNGSLFFNLYFYEILHTTAKEKTAMINWFFTFCHEMAHHFEPLHNARHE
ncbi:5403_t:CDS:10, partial [Paraglomus occultum]